jgi:hypothetical protein
MITYLLNQLSIFGFNFWNSRIDAYRIVHNKHIAHGVNFGAYALFTALLCWLARWSFTQIIIFCVSAFCQRQFSFDIPLNLRRGLKWDYVSPAKPPKALLDRIEVKIFGYNGRAPFLVYGAIWIVCLIIKFFI